MRIELLEVIVSRVKRLLGLEREERVIPLSQTEEITDVSSIAYTENPEQLVEDIFGLENTERHSEVSLSNDDRSTYNSNIQYDDLQNDSTQTNSGRISRMVFREEDDYQTYYLAEAAVNTNGIDWVPEDGVANIDSEDALDILLNGGGNAYIGEAYTNRDNSGYGNRYEEETQEVSSSEEVNSENYDSNFFQLRISSETFGPETDPVRAGNIQNNSLGDTRNDYMREVYTSRSDTDYGSRYQLSSEDTHNSLTPDSTEANFVTVAGLLNIMVNL